MTKKKLFIFLILAILLIAGLFIFKHRSTPAFQGRLENEIWVKADRVKSVSIPFEVQSIGTLIARSVEITPEVAGHVEKIFFTDGALVNQGDQLIQLEDSIYKAKYQSAKARLAYSKNNFKRMMLLGKQGAISKQAIDQAEADLKERKADAKECKVMLNKMRLFAPFPGRVGKSKINRGEYITVSQSVVSVTDINRLRVEYNIPEKYLPLLKLGQEVKITTTAYPDKIFNGTVSFISPTINIENRSISIYATVPNQDLLLTAGMFVNVTHSLGTQKEILLIPARSLIPILGGEQVYKVIEGKAYSVTILTGKRMEDKVQITQGLSPGDTIITDGQHKVKNGQMVKIAS